MLKLLLLVPVILFALVALYDIQLVREMEPDRHRELAPEDSTPRAQPVVTGASRTPFDRQQSLQGEDKLAV
jgi:hypothetical protein